MTDRGRLEQGQADDHYSRVEPVPDPPREPDMQQSEQTFRFRALLRPHFADRDDVLVSGGGYLRQDARQRGREIRTRLHGGLRRRPGRRGGPQRLCDRQGREAAGSGA